MNMQKLAYDLALVYAQAVHTGVSRKQVVAEPDNPQYPSHSSLLTEAFTDMYIELLNSSLVSLKGFKSGNRNFSTQTDRQVAGLF